MGLAAIFGAIGSLIALVTYLYKRKDDPKVAARHLDEKTAKDKQEFDNAIAVNDAEDLTRLFHDNDDRADKLLPPDNSDTVGRDDNSTT